MNADRSRPRNAGGSPSAMLMAKVGFALGGIAAFGIGIRSDNIGIRWAGLGLVAVAWVLRFVNRDQLPDETR